MRKAFAILILASALALPGCAPETGQSGGLKPITPVKFSDVKIDDGFWSPRIKLHKEVTIPVCVDQIENQTDRMRNFENAATRADVHSGICYDDSDVYKALEGMAYSLRNNPDPVLEAKCDEWIGKIAAAQQEDGYLNTYYTLTPGQTRWTDMDKHEMYCAGHMIEAAIAYYNVTGKRKLLDTSIRMVGHMMDVFGPDGRHWVPGHEEVELALVKLYETTGERKYLDFAGWLLDQRGHGYGSYGDARKWWAVHYQDEVPVRELKTIAGHAVRAMYLYCGMADVASYTGDTGLTDALYRLWDHVVLRNMYITGGIGQSARNEGITTDYDLPNKEAYCETCASVGMVLWNWRMFQFTGDSKYADTMERSMYNGALAGISLAGDKFFYVNPLESDGGHHRKSWYGTACCPSQICRFLPSIGNYIYGLGDGALWVNLYIGGTATVELGGKTVEVAQETRYPWEGKVELSLSMKGKVNAGLRLRIPAWCKSYTLSVCGQEVEAPVEKGYAVISRTWRDGDRVELDLGMPVEVVAADPRVQADLGRRAVQRGPLVYCLEQADNPGFEDVRIDPDGKWSSSYKADKLSGIVEVTDGQAVYVPYFAWDNREPGRMLVWVPLAQGSLAE